MSTPGPIYNPEEFKSEAQPGEELSMLYIKTIHNVSLGSHEPLGNIYAGPLMGIVSEKQKVKVLSLPQNDKSYYLAFIPEDAVDAVRIDLYESGQEITFEMDGTFAVYED